MENEGDQKSLVGETQAQALADSGISRLPALGSGQVLVVIDAEDRTTEALDILHRNDAVIEGVRLPAP